MTRLVIAFTVLATCAAFAAPADAPKMGPPEAPTGAELTKVLYALGRSIGMSLEPFGLTTKELGEVVKGLTDAVGDKPEKVKMEEYGPKIQDLARARRTVFLEAKSKAGKAFLEKMGKEKGAQKQASGLIFFDTKAGSGKTPLPTDTVSVHYKGTLPDGKEFDSSYKRGQPAEFPLNGVIKCWTEGVQKIKVGGKAKLICPAEIAYGERGSPPAVPPNSVLVFEVELLSIKGK